MEVRTAQLHSAVALAHSTVRGHGMVACQRFNDLEKIGLLEGHWYSGNAEATMGLKAIFRELLDTYEAYRS